MDSNTSEIAKIDRHCAYCHKLVPAEEVKCCSKCHRRAFCSRECQSADWTPKSIQNGVKKGQGHKNWCGLQAGEEDLDWETAFVTKYKKQPGQERGIVAKQFISKNSRIMIDGFGGDGVNGYFPDYDILKKVLGRSVFTNHACDANAMKSPDPIFKAMIVFAKRDIQEGEEICCNYVLFNEFYDPIPCNPTQDPYSSFYSDPRRADPSYKDPDYIMSFADARKVLETRYNVECPPNCFCYNSPDVEEIIAKSRRCYTGCVWSPDEELQINEVDALMIALSWVKENHEKTRGNPMQKALLLEKMFGLAVQHTKTLDAAKEYIKEAYEIFSSIFHPESLFPARVKKLMDEPQTAPSYLSLDSKTEMDPEEYLAHLKKQIEEYEKKHFLNKAQ